MVDDPFSYGSYLQLAAAVIGVLLAVLWVLLPFAVFGIKNRLDTLIRRVEENTEAIKRDRASQL